MGKKLKPFVSLILAAMMVFSQLPSSVFGEKTTTTANNVITAFEPLDEFTTNQYRGVGTDISELILPDMLTVTVTSGTAIAVVFQEAED